MQCQSGPLRQLRGLLNASIVLVSVMTVHDLCVIVSWVKTTMQVRSYSMRTNAWLAISVPYAKAYAIPSESPISEAGHKLTALMVLLSGPISSMHSLLGSPPAADSEYKRAKNCSKPGPKRKWESSS